MKSQLRILALSLSIPACALAGASMASASPSPSVHAAAHRHAARHPRRSCRTSLQRLPRRCTSATHGPREHRVKARPVSSARAATPPSIPAPSPSSSAAAQEAAAAALAPPCANTTLTPEAGDLALVRAAVLCLVNRERTQNGVPALRLSTQLEAAAESHCAELIARDYFAHVSPSGETPVDRIRGAGYIPGPSVGYVIGENLAWGTYGLATAQAIVSAWIASPGHLANILEAKYTETGIGIDPAVPSSLGDGAPGATYAQEFGVIVR